VNDSDFMLELLSDGREHSTMDIIYRSIRTRGCGITPHSRASDLRRRGHNIECVYGGKVQGRAVWVYKLIGSLPDETNQSFASPLDHGDHTDGKHDRKDEGRLVSSESETLFTYPRSPEWA
jgi:hypothetical protein